MAQESHIKWLGGYDATNNPNPQLGRCRFETFIATTAVTAGDLVALDDSVASGEAVVPRGAATAVAGGADSIPVGIALEAAAAGARVRVAVAGIVDAFCDATTAIAVGTPLSPNQSSPYDSLEAPPDLSGNAQAQPAVPVFAYAREVLASGTGLVEVWLVGR